MGRLFRKFFLMIWSVQLAGIFVTGAIFWWEHQERELDRAALTIAQPASGSPAIRDRHARRPRHAGHIPVVPVIVTLLGSLLSAILLAWYFAKPIRSLRGAFAQAADGNLEVRVGPDVTRRRDELAELGRSFDHMADRLATLLDSQRRLLHDVSHELRSPLARLHAAIDLARQGLSVDTTKRDALTQIEREAERMDELVGELLTLSRLGAGMPERRDEVELAELLDELMADARFELTATGRRITLSGPVDARLRANGQLLHRAIENVVRNALRHSPEGGAVDIHVRMEGGEVVLEVADRGPGVAPEDLTAIFEPFHRGQGSDGHGLGLTIARRVVEGLGGRIYAENRDGDGLRIILRLPLSGPHQS